MRAAMLGSRTALLISLRALLLTAVTGLALSPAVASAHSVTGHITCDNQFAIYTAASEVAGMVLNSAGVTACHPTTATVSFVTSDRYLYIACWSDDAVAQGLLHDLNVDGHPVFSQDPRWRVTYADHNYSPICPDVPADLVPQMASIIPSPPGGWIVPTVGCVNGPTGCYGVWGQFPEIAASARRVWYDSGNQVSPDAPFFPGFNHREFLIFRLDMGAPTVSCASPVSICRGDSLISLSYCVTNSLPTSTSMCVNASNTFSTCTYDTTFVADPGEQVCFTVKCPAASTPAGTYSATMTVALCSEPTVSVTCTTPVVVDGFGRFESTKPANETVAYDSIGTTGSFCVRNASGCADSVSYRLVDTHGWVTGGSALFSRKIFLVPDEEFCLTADFHAASGPGVKRDTLDWVIDVGGNLDSSRTVLTAVPPALLGVADPVGAARLQLGRPIPNPVTNLFRISADLPRAGHASLRIVDVSGRVVTVLGDSDLQAGRHEFVWSRERGRVSAGFYFVVLDVDGERLNRPLIVLR